MRTFLSAFLWFYWAVCIITFFLIISILFLVTFTFDRFNCLPNRMLKGLAWIMIHANPGWECEIRGADQEKIATPTIIIANHQSFMDMPLLYLLPWRMKWVAKKTLFKIPIFGWIVYMTGHLGIDRTSTRSVKKLDKLVEPVRAGIPGMIFPEGTRSPDGELGSFKNGAFKLARQYNFKVLPIVLEGGHKAMPAGNWRFRFNQKFVISVLDPLSPADFDTTHSLKDHTYSLIQQELKRIRSE